MRREELWKLSVLQGQEHKDNYDSYRLEAVPAINTIVDKVLGNAYKSSLFECPSC